MNKMRSRTKQILMFCAVSVLGAIGGIAHGVFFDLDFSQIKRLTFQGVLFTSLLVFPALLFIEWLFDWNNAEEMEDIKRRIKRLEESISQDKGDAENR